MKLRGLLAGVVLGIIASWQLGNWLYTGMTRPEGWGTWFTTEASAITTIGIIATGGSLFVIFREYRQDRQAELYR